MNREQVIDEVKSLVRGKKNSIVCVRFLCKWIKVKEDGVSEAYTWSAPHKMLLDEDKKISGSYEAMFNALRQKLARFEATNEISSGLTLVEYTRVAIDALPFSRASVGTKRKFSEYTNVEKEILRKRLKKNIDKQSWAWILFAADFLQTSNKCPTIRNSNLYFDFVNEHSLRVAETDIATLSNLYEGAKRYNRAVIVWNIRKVAILSVEGEEPIIHLFFDAKTSKLHVVNNISDFLTKKSKGTFCKECLTCHKKECDKKIEMGEMRLYNTTQEKLVFNYYADFECIGVEDEHIQEPVTIGCVRSDMNAIAHFIRAEKGEPEDVVNDFLSFITENLQSYQGKKSVAQAQCPCGYYGLLLLFRNYTNKERELLCEACIRTRQFPSVFFHNFSGYDVKILFRFLTNQDYEISLAARTSSKINNMTFVYKHDPRIRFCLRDSLSFINGRLAELANQLPDELKEKIPKKYRDINLGGKGIFPYDKFTRVEMLEEKLPKEASEWKSLLSTEEIKQEDVDRLFMILQKYGEQPTFRNLVTSYCLNDCYVLALYFENVFRTPLYNLFGVEAGSTYSAPSAGWRIVTTCTDALPEEELRRRFYILPDVETYRLFQSQIRGGVAQTCYRRYVNTSEGGEILCLDVNTLYSSCMLEKLPQNLVDVRDTALENEPITNPDEDLCNIWLVDLEYPEELFDDPKHLHLPLAPHHFAERLMTTFLKKENYLVHQAALQFYVDNGLVITARRKVFTFVQGYTLRDFVKENIDRRNNSKDPFEKDTIKKIGNSIYGKTVENVFRYRQFKIEDVEDYDSSGQEDEASINASLSNAKSFSLVSKNKALVERDNKTIVCNKPIQIGFTILDLAKIAIYRGWHAVLRVFPKAELLYTDTDSMFIFVPEEGALKKLASEPEFDLPYDGDTALPPKKIPGLFSNDLGPGETAEEYIGVRSKCYYLKTATKEKMRCKGVSLPRSTVDNQRISREHYVSALMQGEAITVNFNEMHTTKDLTVLIKNSERVAMTSADVKHYYEDRFVGLPWGYRKMYSYEEMMQ